MRSLFDRLHRLEGKRKNDFGSLSRIAAHPCACVSVSTACFDFVFNLQLLCSSIRKCCDERPGKYATGTQLNCRSPPASVFGIDPPRARRRGDTLALRLRAAFLSCCRHPMPLRNYLRLQSFKICVLKASRLAWMRLARELASYPEGD